MNLSNWFLVGFLHLVNKRTFGKNFYQSLVENYDGAMLRIFSSNIWTKCDITDVYWCC